MARAGGSSPRRYQRTDRLNELLREVVADQLERIGDDVDERLRLVTITGVSTVSDLAVATVYYSTLGDEADAAAGLEAQRHRLQRAVATQVRARRTPVLTFRADPGILAGRQVDALLREHPVRPDDVPLDPALYRDLGDGPVGGEPEDPASVAGGGAADLPEGGGDGGTTHA
jgi:ribosome-binding factor A